jgi:ubiquinone/menaquinone biosynthesis C-methylase UbiE
MSDEVSLQRASYRASATKYDAMHLAEAGEHEFALAFMMSMIKFFDIKSVLDIGSGTGRALLVLKQAMPNLRVLGIEPSLELRDQGHKKGLTELIDGDAQALNFRDGEFELVCEFGALHHIPKPATAVSEMLRVAATAVFISDSNNFGQGRWVSRTLKQGINALGLWPIVKLIKTKGKGYSISQGDGLFYSYSVFNNYQQVRTACKQVHILNTTGSGVNPYRSASHVALLGVK